MVYRYSAATVVLLYSSTARPVIASAVITCIWFGQPQHTVQHGYYMTMLPVVFIYMLLARLLLYDQLRLQVVVIRLHLSNHPHPHTRLHLSDRHPLHTRLRLSDHRR